MKNLLSKALRPAIANNGNKILEYHALQNFTPRWRKGEIALSFKYRNVHCYTLNAIQWTQTSNNHTGVLAARHLQRWAERTDYLWWSALAHTNVGKRTVRSHATRRLRLAFVESLRKAGYASDGSPLPDEENRAPLVGTAMLGATAAMLKTKNDALLEQTDLLVEHMIKQQGHRRVKIKNGYKAEGRLGKERKPKQDPELQRAIIRTIRH